MHKFMLDTNIVIYIIKRRPLELLNKFNENTGSMVISSITFAELLHGVEKSATRKRNMDTVENFVSRLAVLDYNDKAAWHYGNIRANLECKGTPIGVNDVHIAAHARSAGLVLVTNNRKEFDRVEGLIVQNWL